MGRASKRARPNPNPYAGGSKSGKPGMRKLSKGNLGLKQQNASSSSSKSKAKQLKSTPQAPFNPFSDPETTILLVGEGDFSFSRSLLDHHGCYRMTCTSYDDEKTVMEKYPQAKETMEYLKENEQMILNGIDATKLAKTKQLKKKQFSLITFMFPHIGGVSKDQDRQVRANQELLLNFFTSAIPILEDGGKICVALFEGMPYELWEIRKLAQAAGLRTLRSGKFDQSEFPGYKHARTLGNIEGEGAWKGEERDARLYIFEKNDGKTISQQRKRKKKDESSSDEDE